MKTTVTVVSFVSMLAIPGHAWVSLYHPQRVSATSSSSCLNAAVGIFFGTSTGNTETCAEKIYEAFGADIAAEPVDVDTLNGDELSTIFGEHDALIVGAPTWNTGADTERSGTGWDELYYSNKLPAQLKGKKVAVFGLGDQISYTENYADATGELYDVFESLGCDMVSYAMTSQDGYEHEASKSIRGDLFCGLLLDEINQEDLSDERAEAWVAQLKEGGFLESAGGASINGAAVAESPAVVEAVVIEEIAETLEDASAVLDETIAAHSTATDFTPHYNPVTQKTMWTSPDGRKSFVTVATEAPTKLRP